jgi:hypothetical protein
MYIPGVGNSTYGRYFTILVLSFCLRLSVLISECGFLPSKIVLFFVHPLLLLGINAAGIRKVIKAPSRYAIPIIVSTGLPFKLSPTIYPFHNHTSFDDRYSVEELMFGNWFGAPIGTNMTTS